jgi:hypothetical protein
MTTAAASPPDVRKVSELRSVRSEMFIESLSRIEPKLLRSEMSATEEDLRLRS